MKPKALLPANRPASVQQDKRGRSEREAEVRDRKKRGALFQYYKL